MEFFGRNFGLLIAYVIPGFVALWGAGLFSDPVRRWLTSAPDIPGGIEAMFFVSLASVAAGLVVSSLRWMLVDTLHHCTGIPRPAWDDANLQINLQAFDSVVEAHYRYYQFHANLAVAVAFSFAAWHATRPEGWAVSSTADLGFVCLEALLLATSRDNLRKYYARSARILGPMSQSLERKSTMSNGNHPKPVKKPQPAQGEPKATGKSAKPK